MKMARSSSNLLFLSILNISQMLILFSSYNVVLGQDCQGDFRGLITQCAVFVQKPGPVMDPSPSCCNIIKGVNVPCVCRHVTKEVEQIIDMMKVVHVSLFCGKPLARGTKCGSFTVP